MERKVEYLFIVIYLLLWLHDFVATNITQRQMVQRNCAFSYKSRVLRTKVPSQSTSGFRFLRHPTDLNEPAKPVTSVILLLQHRESYKPSKKWSYLRIGLSSMCTKVLSIHLCQNCHSFIKLATLKMHSWKELSNTILMV